MANTRVIANPAASTALRGLLLLIAGLVAVVWPVGVITTMLIAGAVLLIIEGALGLWALSAGTGRSGDFRFDLIANLIALVIGLVTLIGPWVATQIATTFFVYLLACALIFVGLVQIWLVIRMRQNFQGFWGPLFSGLAFVAFGLIIMLFPLQTAEIVVQLAGGALIIIGAALCFWAWRLWERARLLPNGPDAY